MENKFFDHAWIMNDKFILLKLYDILYLQIVPIYMSICIHIYIFGKNSIRLRSNNTNVLADTQR